MTNAFSQHAALFLSLRVSSIPTPAKEQNPGRRQRNCRSPGSNYPRREPSKGVTVSRHMRSVSPLQGLDKIVLTPRVPEPAAAGPSALGFAMSRFQRFALLAGSLWPQLSSARMLELGKMLQST